jgi:hypothetical protein
VVAFGGDMRLISGHVFKLTYLKSACQAKLTGRPSKLCGSEKEKSVARNMEKTDSENITATITKTLLSYLSISLPVGFLK